MLLVEVRPHQYHDSIVLMVASARMSALPGVEAAMAAMATPLNVDLLRETGLWSDDLAGAGDTDLVLAARGSDPAAALQAAERALTERAPVASGAEAAAPRTIRTAARALPGANVAVVSVPGEHAAWACWDALAQDLNVFCFSDNVTVADEVRLKDEALRRGLLMMGPDCGTAILDGVGFGFSNAVPRGRVGIVGASGTGIQQLACLLAHQGVGISHAIGVGGRDLSPEVGGRMAREAVRRLDADPDTDLIVVISKPATADLSARKPLVKAMLGPGVDLTAIALEVGAGRLPADPPLAAWPGRVDGLFSGGTLRDEAALIWAGDPRFTAVDYGDDRYTRGRPHPMIDNTLRLEAIRRSEGLVYLDVVLGRGAHPDPAAELAPALAGRPAVVVLVGVEGDPQGLARQRAGFEAAGAAVFLSNARAARAVRGEVPILGPEGPRAVTVGAALLADSLEAPKVRVDWRPPLQRLAPDPAVDDANRVAVERMLAARPMLVAVGTALETIPGMRPDLLLHSGPPLAWEAASGPLRGALEGSLRLEGRDAADLEPCHHHDAVGPMAGVISAGMPVLVVEDADTGGRAYSNLNEGLGRVLRYGANDDAVLDRLRWMASALGPDLARALAAGGPIDLGAINQRALQMGDELHNRHRAATSLLFRELALRGLSTESLRFIDGNDYFYLNFAMAAAKLACECAAGVDGSSLVVTMARNGTEFGIRVSAAPDRWFTAPAAVPVGLFLGSYTQADANPDIGDSAITETYGLGGFAMAAAAAITRVVGGSARTALETTLEMYEITLAENPNHQVPALDFRGTPTGIDVRRVVETGIQPVINTGIAHREAGVGQVGAGLVRAPLEPFLAAHRFLNS